MNTRWGNASCSQSTLSCVEWTRCQCSGGRSPAAGSLRASGPNGLSHSWMYLGTAGISSGLSSSMSRFEKISILPEVWAADGARVAAEVGEGDLGLGHRHRVDATVVVLELSRATAARASQWHGSGRVAQATQPLLVPAFACRPPRDPAVAPARDRSGSRSSTRRAAGTHLRHEDHLVAVLPAVLQAPHLELGAGRQHEVGEPRRWGSGTGPGRR